MLKKTYFPEHSTNRMEDEGNLEKARYRYYKEKPTNLILNKLKEYEVTSIVKMASSYKFCVIATGEYDIYAARERANEWDYAAGHAIAQNAGAIIKTLDEKPFLYGKEDYKNPSLLIKRSNNLHD